MKDGRLERSDSIIPPTTFTNIPSRARFARRRDVVLFHGSSSLEAGKFYANKNPDHINLLRIPVSSETKR